MKHVCANILPASRIDTFGHCALNSRHLQAVSYGQAEQAGGGRRARGDQPLNASFNADLAEGEATNLYFDVTGDGALAPADALAVIIFLNAKAGSTNAQSANVTGAEGEGPPPSADSLQQQAAVDEALQMWRAANADDPSTQRRN